jgi:hypothetical protein
MNKVELRQRIKNIIKTKYSSKPIQVPIEPEYEEINKFPDIETALISLLTEEYNNFLASIDWVAPKPTTFRINLRNNHFFYLIAGDKSWIAEIEGKPYYLINISEKESAIKALSHVLRYMTVEDKEEEESTDSFESSSEDTDTTEEPEAGEEFSL